MAIVNPPDAATANADAQIVVLNIRNAFNNEADFFGWFSTLSVADIESVFSVDNATALVYQSTFGNLDHLRGIYEGVATQAAVLNFKANSAPLWGGK